jgi:uncharacterized protein (TIGR02996 family)
MAKFMRDGETAPRSLVRAGTVVTDNDQRSTYATELEALAAFDRRANDLVDEGWGVIEVDNDLGLPRACDEAQERAILAAGDDRDDRLAVYTDWLIERGDPCGELASLRARNEKDNDPALAALIQRFELQHERPLFGLFHGVRAPRGVVKLVWRRGWVDALDIATSSDTFVSLALLAPVARFVRGLVFQRQVARRVCRALARSPRRDHIRRLQLAFGDVQPVLDALPALDTLALNASMFIERGHPRVRRIELASFGTNTLDGRWPGVDTLALTMTPHMVRPRALSLLRPFPALRTIELGGDPAACDALAAELPRSVHLIRT